MACEIEAIWFAAMEARARAVAAETTDATEARVETVPQAGELPPPERGRGGEGVASEMQGESAGRGTCDESVDPLPNPPPEEGGGGVPRAIERLNRDGKPVSRFSCEETQTE
jgi:hypothetical protein